MNINTQDQAVLLLTVWFSKPAKGDPKPLTPTEWGRFALWLKEQGTSPEALMTGDPAKTLAGWSDRTVTIERIRYLLGRAGALGLALERWQRAGLWVMTRSDQAYPSRLKQRLKFDAPPVLFGCGNRQLLDQGGIAVVGSRDASRDDLAYTTLLGGTAALQAFAIVSGGARGVDETAMLGALERGGQVVGVLADSLLRAATSAKYRRGLMANNLVLVSPFSPEAGFNVGNAMARNKYIYCISDAAVVIATSKGKGGTWSGAIEDLKQGWVPLWVKTHADDSSGNAALVRQGGRWLPGGDFEVRSLVVREVNAQLPPKEPGLFDILTMEPEPPEVVTEPPSPEYGIQRISTPVEFGGRDEAAKQANSAGAQIDPATQTFFEFFLLRIEALTSREPATVDQLLLQLDISKSQLNEWLNRGVTEGRVAKLNRPVRYQALKVELR